MLCVDFNSLNYVVVRPAIIYGVADQLGLSKDGHPAHECVYVMIFILQHLQLHD